MEADIQSVINLLNDMLNGVEVDESEIHRCLFIMSNLNRHQKKSNNLRIVFHEDD